MNDGISNESSDQQREHLRPNMDISDNGDGDWLLAKQGIVMWLNNEPEKAESFLKAHIENSVHALTSYTFISVIVSSSPSRPVAHTVHRNYSR